MLQVNLHRKDMIKTKKLFIVFIATLLCFSTLTANAASMTIYYSGSAHEYNGRTYKLMIDGEYIYPSVEPLIFNDYTLVPIRDVFEAMGATVKYLDLSKQIFINYEETYLRLRIGDTIAHIDDEKVKIPGGITPMLISLDNINAKTMVPLRFVSESLGFKVDFIDEEDLIKISTQPVEFSTLNNFTTVANSSVSTTITVYFDKAVQSVTKPGLTNSGVLYFDIENCKYSLNNTNAINKGAIKNLRFGLSDNKTRVALDLENMKSYDVKLSDDKKAIKIEVTASKSVSDNTQTPPEDNTPDNSQNNNQDNTVTRPSPNLGEKLVVIDAGHGGSDPGAVATHNGKEYHEKELNLTIAKKVKDILEGQGITVIMTRDSDTYPSLTKRHEIANSNLAAMFVSIHTNSATVDTATGFEVYYSKANNREDTGLLSSDLAKTVCDEIDDLIDTRNRGVKTANHVVTKNCYMPAILVEVGFISTPSELELMFTDKFCNNFAKGIANGIIKSYSGAKPLTKEIIEEIKKREEEAAKAAAEAEKQAKENGESEDDANTNQDSETLPDETIPDDDEIEE